MITAGIIHNTEKDQALIFYDRLVPFLTDNKVRIADDNSLHTADFFIVIGGDGTLLRASKILEKFNRPILAVNMGSLGFLTDIRENEALNMIDNVIKNNFRTDPRRFLRLEFNGEEYLALNDIVITRSSHLARMVRIKALDRGVYINTYSADGLIISSPSGSTAYNLSAGGPILTPDINAMVITPIAPHTLSARPIVVSGTNTLTVEADPASGVVQIMIDGQHSLAFSSNDRALVTMSQKSINLITLPGRDFYSVLREKLKWGDALF